MSELFKQMIYKQYPKQNVYLVYCDIKNNTNDSKSTQVFLRVSELKEAYYYAVKYAIGLLCNQYVVTEKTLKILNSKNTDKIKYEALQYEYLSLFSDIFSKIIIEPINKNNSLLPIFIKNTQKYQHINYKKLKDYNKFYHNAKFLYKFNSNDNGHIEIFESAMDWSPSRKVILSK